MKNNKKLLIQVGIIIAVFFAVLIIVLGSVIYTGTTTMFLHAKNEMIDRDLLRVKKIVDDVPKLSVFVNYWETHYDRMRTELLPEEYEAGGSVYSESGIIDSTLDFNSFTDAEQLVLAHDTYSGLAMAFNEEQYQFRYADIYLVEITEENCGYVICRGNGDSVMDRSSIGTEMEIDITGHHAVEKMRSGTYAATEYEIIDSALGKSYYVGYAPIEADGSVKYAVCILYDWASFKSVLTDNLFMMLTIGLVLMACAGCLLLHFLSKTAIEPVTAIQRTVRNYIDSKDSGAVTESMERIKTGNEFGSLAVDIAQLAEEIDRYTADNLRLARENERVATELDLATKIQSGSLPSVFPAFPKRREFDIFASMTPAKEVGGDFYDFFLIDDDHLGLVIADVSGKGVPAALFMMSSMILIHDRAFMGGTPSEILSFVNERICQQNPFEMFVTVWFGILEISTGKLSCTNAGHEKPEMKINSRFELLNDKHCLVLGAMSGVPFSTYELQLEKDDILFVYTDGVAEATNSSDELFGTERLTDALNSASGSSPEELIKAVRRAVDDFVGDAPQFDDLTMLCMKYYGPDTTDNP